MTLIPGDHLLVHPRIGGQKRRHCVLLDALKKEAELPRARSLADGSMVFFWTGKPGSFRVRGSPGTDAKGTVLPTGYKGVPQGGEGWNVSMGRGAAASSSGVSGTDARLAARQPPEESTSRGSRRQHQPLTDGGSMRWTFCQDLLASGRCPSWSSWTWLWSTRRWTLGANPLSRPMTLARRAAPTGPGERPVSAAQPCTCLLWPLRGGLRG